MPLWKKKSDAPFRDLQLQTKKTLLLNLIGIYFQKTQHQIITMNAIYHNRGYNYKNDFDKTHVKLLKVENNAKMSKTHPLGGVDDINILKCKKGVEYPKICKNEIGLSTEVLIKINDQLEKTEIIR